MPRIVPNSWPEYEKGTGGRTGSIYRITHKEITTILGFKPNVEDDGDKVKYSWGATVDGRDIAIWDYRGSWRDKEFSTNGPTLIFVALFGDRYVRER